MPDLANCRATMPKEHIHFVTGKLAAQSLQRIVAELGGPGGFDYSLEVLPISVAALMTTDWVARHAHPPQGASRMILPGHCQGSLPQLEHLLQLPVVRGPKDLRELPAFFGRGDQAPRDYGPHDIAILAEINHAPRMGREPLLRKARRLVADGADVIDLGCDPGQDTCRTVGESVKALRDEGIRVSIDSFNSEEIALATSAGAELVLSVNQSNRQHALDWNCEVVAIPDDVAHPESLIETMEFLSCHSVPFRIDPVLEPIGFGFADSLQRYGAMRQQFPSIEMMMGIGNLTELTDVDSSGVNTLLLAVCQELGIRSVLTTQVISWARTSVRECDLARRLVYHAVTHRTLPKHLEPRLVLLRDATTLQRTEDEVNELASLIRDRNFRVFLAGDQIHVLNRDLHVSGSDPYQLLDGILQASPHDLAPSHAFYLGYELAKAVTALTLGKNYEQDQALQWGFLTRPERSRHREEHDRAES